MGGEAVSILLYEHNQCAYDAAITMLAKQGKAAIIHPTGTGKSFIGFKLCEEYPSKKICWLSPSEYIFQTQIENVKKTSDGYVPENICFFTYARLMNMTVEEMKSIQPDYIILDEFHRCGAEMWGEGVKNLLSFYPNVPILGLSATAIRYLDNQRDMADELFDGNVASEMTLGEAIVKGILHPPTYVLSMFSYQQDLERYKLRIKNAKNKEVRDAAKQYFEALRRALEKADGLDEIFRKHMKDKCGKYIVFCANAEHMQEMIDKVPEWFSKVDVHPNVYSAYSDDPETSKAFAGFKEDNSEHLKLLFCINMLNEGIHVEDVSGVILFRPTISPIIYKQQIGRALSATKAKEPIIFDIVNNIENLYSIRELEAELQDAVRDLYISGGERTTVEEHFKIVDEVRDCKELFRKLTNTLSSNREVMLETAQQYYEEFGNLDMHQDASYEGIPLGNWITQQRTLYGKGELSQETFHWLNARGMDWRTLPEKIWDVMFDEAKKFYERNQHLDIPAEYVTEGGATLGRWYRAQRSDFKRGTLSAERQKRLEEIGMKWTSVQTRTWLSYYNLAAEYYQEHGNLQVHLRYETSDGIKLGTWISSQRGFYAQGKLKAEQIQMLEAIGMEWNRFQSNWDAAFAYAKEHYQKCGNLNVSATYTTDSGFKLGAWLNSQRVKYKKQKLTPEQVSGLESIGIVWAPNDALWFQGYEKAKNYYMTTGSLEIPTWFITGEGFHLGQWVGSQRRKLDNNALEPAKVDLLSQIGICLLKAAQ